MSKKRNSSSQAQTVRAAILDVGSNSVKFMLAEQRQGTLRILKEKATTTRLGGFLALTGKISKKSVTETLEVLRHYHKQAMEMGAEKIVAVGTSALRSAGNSGLVLKQARSILGTSIEIVSGKLEGELVYAGATISPRWRKKAILVIDVGGGSVEFVWGEQGRVHKSISLPLGCVRIRDLFLQEQPPDPLGWQNAAIHLETQIKKRIAPFLVPGVTCVGTGGTMVTLAMIQRGHHAGKWSSRIEGTKLSIRELQKISTTLSEQTLKTLHQNDSIPQARADIITAGSLIYWSALRALGLKSIHCSTHGLRYGLWGKRLAPQPITRMIYATD
jgi:exopolyphosphatase / guanosine-5'-triphosphate,3'-diphosphate pyrophosphatase